MVNCRVLLGALCLDQAKCRPPWHVFLVPDGTSAMLSCQNTGGGRSSWLHSFISNRQDPY
jgi:hypothetical protein